MLAPTHLVFGLSLTVGFCHMLDVRPEPTELVLIFAGSLLPDIDGGGVISKPGSILSRFLNRPLRVLLDRIGAIISSIVRSICRHRGFFHWPIVGIAIVAYGLYVSKDWIFWLGFGYLTHLLGDALTREGIPVFAPFSRKSYSVSLFTTGSKTEAFICISLLLVSLYFGFPMLPEQTRSIFTNLLSIL